MNLPSVSNRKLTLLRKLNRKKYRYKKQLFLLEGARAVEQVLENQSVKVQTLFFDESQQYWLQDGWEQTAQKIDSFTLPANEFAEVSDTETPQGVLALCRMPEEISTEKLASKTGIIVALDGVQDPGNAGTIMRSATWFGAAGILSGKGTVDLFHPKVVRGTAGATGVIPVINADLNKLLPDFEERGWSVFLLDAGAEAIRLTEVPSVKKAVIVVGNEAHGLDSTLFASGRQKVRISSPGDHKRVESLNAAIATSIALYELAGKLE